MHYGQLGETEIEVSRIVLGCGNFGGIGSAPAFFGMGESEPEAFELMDAAWEAGITTFDTADAYGGGRSESWIGGWLRSKGPNVRDQIVLSTKVFHSVAGDPSDHGLAPGRIHRQIDDSLARLGVEQVEMYLMHGPDQTVPVAETLEAFDELVRLGRVRAFGASNVSGAQLEEALRASDAGGLLGVGWVQNSFSLLDRAAESDVLPVCGREGLGFMPFGPLAGGWLTGKYRAERAYEAGSRMSLRPEPYAHLENDRTYRALGQLEAVARRRGLDMSALAIAWLLADARVTAVVVGPRRPAHLAPALTALDVQLSQAEHDELSAIFA